MAEDTRAVVGQFVRGKMPKVELGDDQDFFQLGFVNSLFAMELVMFVENRFGLRVPNDELRRENFRSVSAISDLVDRLTPAREPVPQEATA
ncbi:phosphopantetheine-binding protein [Actinosynnema sp. NPDC059797]